MDIAGHWTGHYFQRVHAPADGTGAEGGENIFPVEAWLDTYGNKLSGKMLDLRTDRVESLAQAFANQKDELGWVNRLLFRIFLWRHPRATSCISLFPQSVLEGTVNGDSVVFEKTYSGPCEYRIRQAGRERIARLPSQKIQYKGVVREGGGLISGTYELPSSKPKPLIQTFELRKNSGSG